MGYAKISFFKLMNWLYVRYSQITPVELMRNLYEIQVTYNIEDIIDIIFD